MNLQPFKHKMYKVTYTGTCIIPMASSKKNSIGQWRHVGKKVKDWDLLPCSFQEPTEELVKAAIQFCNPHLKIETVSWKYLGEF